MPDLNLTKLRKIAEAAMTTPGPWSEYQYLLAFDPPTALALIDEIEQVRGQVNSVRGILERSPDCNKYPAESTPHCGWKSDLNAIRETLNGGGSDE